MLYLYALVEDAHDISVFEQIYKQFRAGLFQIAYGILHDVQLSEDVVAETFIKVAKNIKMISQLSCNKRRDYLVIIVRNTAIDVYRRRHQEAIPIDFVEAVSEVVTVEDIVLGKLGYLEIVNAIDKLPPKYRDVIKLRCLYQHTAEETGNLLGIPANTVNQHLARAKAKLLKLLEEGSACGDV
ncbi:RNA polymerase sigma factor [Agathobaculum sp. NTUH-O15-33]|uniref:RNA polymerase sigma factor n=1 Tax=Agathobaculum sp. NTUH-O15-33 TaxID=3079302 RepID=UPI002958AF02|nr:RNA polymerase sigma factor [Agathobaculum sp. NTUH-O15-33]WNX84671.1 RNA polymerase sigma factor [Agathobaculum sp. NTUH-O15-33]